jgi:hypothetical protein
MEIMLEIWSVNKYKWQKWDMNLLLNKWIRGVMSMVFIMAVSFIGGGNRSTTKNTTDQPQVTDKLYCIMLYREHLTRAGFELTLVVIGTDIGVKRNINRNWHHNTEMTRWRHVTDQWRTWTTNCVCIILKKIRVFIDSWFLMPWSKWNGYNL